MMYLITSYAVQLFFIISLIVGQSLGDDDPIVTTKLGQIQGNLKNISDQYYEEFLGVQYGRIPKRFQYSKVNSDHWMGILKADTYGPKCTQLPIEGTSEDCLFLNIWRPVVNESITKISPLPVLLWVHGSGYREGSGSDNPGDVITSLGSIIVVTINYRLGAFGFAFGDTDHIQNQGISDVITALKWTRENIGYFGGDPEQVTLSGHSAGSMISSTFPVLPTIDHSLYSQLFILSGVSVHPMFIENTTIAIDKTKLLAEKVGCGPVPEGPLTKRVVRCLQTVNASIIIEKNQDEDIKAIGGAEHCAFIPVYGTPLIPKPLIDLFWSSFNSTSQKIKIVDGISKDETAAFWGYLKPKTRAEGWSMAWDHLSYIKKDLTETEMKPFYDFYFKDSVDGDDRSLRTALTNFMNDYSFRCTSLALSEIYSNRHSIHFTEFDYILDKYGPEARPDGPWHGDSVELFFGNPLRPNNPNFQFFGTRSYSVRDEMTSMRLIELMVGFVTNGTLVDWPELHFDRLKPKVEPRIREINYQDTNVNYEKQSICVEWSKLLGFDVTIDLKSIN
ncbi:cholinesterase-like [Panonychus citri]|uniref:cholinesterase-like n=1 Tax=Panonychus citri TaxID=50023 RepID=UPI002307A88C|nr:cholinesterase-like [Panonychus citri]